MNIKGQSFQAYLVVIFLFFLCIAAPQNDEIKQIPGFPKDYPTKAYAGYLKTQNDAIKHYYLLLESANGSNNTDPLLLYLNGGPGCSSNLGFIQQIGPYILQDGNNYKLGDTLIQNKHSWHKLANILFIQHPGGVGFSTNGDTSHKFNDKNAIDDLMTSLLDFFNKFNQYKGRQFWISGVSYAGIYIPNLAARINAYNSKQSENQKINMHGMIIGNGAISSDGFPNNQYEFFMDHDFIDPQLYPIYQRACRFDPGSAACQYFLYRFGQDTKNVDFYNIYGYCFVDSIQTGNQGSADHARSTLQLQKNNMNPCLYAKGIQDYFTLNKLAFKADKSVKQWIGPCSQEVNRNFIRDPQGSIASYKTLLTLGIKIILFNGDFDAIITENYVNNILTERLNLKMSFERTPFFVNNQHAGFIQLYSDLYFITIKGGSHVSPKNKRQVIYSLVKEAFQDQGFIKMKPGNH